MLARYPLPYPYYMARYRYRDTETGQFVSRVVWEREHDGRYVRESTTFATFRGETVGDDYERFLDMLSDYEGDYETQEFGGGTDYGDDE